VTADGALVAVHLWPSGARTVVETSGAGRRINSQRAYDWLWPDPRPEGADSICPRSDTSSNTFCFHPG
jgi:hypothetical protein